MYIESIKIEDGVVYNLEYHQRRYEEVVRSLKKIPLSLADYIEIPKERGVWRCRVLYDADEILKVEYFSYSVRKIESLKIVESDALDYSKKYADRGELDKLFLQRGECDDILIVVDGCVSDISIANIAFLKEGVWYTPSKPLLKGTTRERLLESKKIVAKEIKVKDIYSYERVALLNAMIDFAIIPQQNIRKVIC